MAKQISIRDAKDEDAPLVLEFIRALARYEKLDDQVDADLEGLRRRLFDPAGPARCLLAFCNDRPVGFALYFFNFSTFLGRPGLYLEDLFVLPEARDEGVGLILLRALAKIAAEKKCGRMEWAVLDWNQKAIKFYERLGAKPVDGWTIYRLDRKAIESLSKD